ncbi:hypothetical protein ACEQ8H_001301 [Pleosporales sp. CAS-2024a]
MAEPTPTLPTPPFHVIPSIANLRDAAASLGTPSLPLRSGLLFRSGDVSKLSASGWSALHALNIRHIFDLRSLPEVGFAPRGRTPAASTNNTNNSDDVPAPPGPGPEPEPEPQPQPEPAWITAMHAAGITRTWAPVFTQADYSPEGIAKRYVKYMDEDAAAGFVSVYRDILRSGAGAYAAIARYMVGHPGAGVLVHCSAGKDRTGVFFAVLFAFLGVPDARIADEYQLTELGLAEIRADVVQRLLGSSAFRAYMLSKREGRELSAGEMAELFRDEKEGKSGSRGGGPGDGDTEFDEHVLRQGREAALRMVSARKETMMATLEMLRDEFGGAEKYLTDTCGLTADELKKLRENLVRS